MKILQVKHALGKLYLFVGCTVLGYSRNNDPGPVISYLKRVADRRSAVMRSTFTIENFASSMAQLV